MGDPVRAYQAGFIINEILENNLLSQVSQTGTFLFTHLHSLSRQYPKYISKVRGQGTYMAFDCESAQVRDQLVHALRQNGVNMGGSGVQSIRLRPMLILEEGHARVFLNVLEETIKKLSSS